MLARRSIIHLAWWLTTGAAPLQAQLYVGVVRDSVARRPVAGVVISAIDSTGKSAGRTLSDQDGRYRLVVPSSAVKLRVQRIGYRMRDLRVALSADETTTIDIQLAPVPSLLDPVRVLGSASCPRRRDNAAAQALYEQARAGLLATIVAREATPAKVVRYAFERPVMKRPDEAFARIRIDSTPEATRSFSAAFTGEEFVRLGFQRKVGSNWQYFGPDADVLLDEGFANGYCFSIASQDRSRQGQIGLSFAAANKQKGRVDIVGTLWVDTLARSLKTIEYKYTGVGGLAGYLDTGGSTSFLEMPNGVVVIAQWGLRMVNTATEWIPDGQGKSRTIRSLIENEGGGFLAKAMWPDGTSWIAPMGTARLRLMLNDSTPVVANAVRLGTTDYSAVTDSSGRVEFRDLFPGRYRLVVADTLLEELGWEPEPQFDFQASPGQTLDARVRVQSTAEQLMRKCVNKTSRADLVAVVNVKDAAVGAPGVEVNVTVNGRTFSETTPGTGSFVLCFDRNALGSSIEMVGTRGVMQTQTLSHTLTKRVTLFRLQLAPKPPLPHDTVSRDPD